MDEPVIIDRRADGMATVTLNRPERHNAYDDDLIARIARAFRDLGADEGVRVVVLAAAGRSFSAGADIAWMRRAADYPFDRNVEDALHLAHMLKAIHQCPKPTLALVHGAAYGGGVGLVAACDIAIASETATFALTEVKFGLIPSVISPYLVGAIGPRACRRYFLTGERFGATEARRLGLIHEVVSEHRLEAARDDVVASLVTAGPDAQASVKELIHAVADRPLDETLMVDTAHRAAKVRSSPEAREGALAFLEKRKAWWIRS